MYHNTTPQITFLLRPPHITLQQPLSSTSSSNNWSIVSSSFTSNYCSSHSYQHLSNTDPNCITTSYKRPSKYSPSSSNSFDQLQLDDASSTPTINIATSLGLPQFTLIPSEIHIKNHSTILTIGSDQVPLKIPLSTHNPFSNTLYGIHLLMSTKSSVLLIVILIIRLHISKNITN